MKKGKSYSREAVSNALVIFTISIVVLLLLVSIVASTAQQIPERDYDAATRSGNYLRIGIQSPIENLNPLTIQDVWSAKTARGPIYSGLSQYHEDSELVIPWIAYDWSPMGASGVGIYDPSLNYVDGVYDPSQAYIDPDPDTVENEAIPSGDLEVVVRIRPDILFHRARAWENDTWQSPKNSSFSMPMDTMKYATAHDVVFSGEMLQWEAALYKTRFLPLVQDTLGDRRDATDSNWVVNGGTGMYEGMQLYPMPGDRDKDICDYSIRFELERPYSLFYLSFPMPLSMKVWAEHTLLDIGSNNALRWDLGQGGTIEDQKMAIAGTGPFMWDDWDRGNYIRLAKNPEYWVDGSKDLHRSYGLSLNGLDHRSWIGGLEFIIRSTTDSAVLSLERGEVDVLSWPIDPGYITRIPQHPDFDVMSTPDFGYYYMGFNMRRPAFGYKDYPGAGEELGTWYGEDISQKFRQAVTHATDKSYIVNNLLQGYGAVGWSVVSQDNTLYHNRTVEKYPYDIERAKELLEEQNEIWRNELEGFNTVWTAPGPGETPDVYPIPRRDAEGNIYEDTGKFYLHTPTADYDPIRAKAADHITETLREECGINIYPARTFFQVIIRNLDPGIADFDMYLSGWSIGGFESLVSLESFFHSRNDRPGGYNFPGFRHEEYDMKVEEAEREMSLYERINLVKELAGIISKELPYNVLYYRSNINAYRNEWTGWVAWPGGICNLYSYAYVRKQGGSYGSLRISAPSDVGMGTEHNVTIRLFDYMGNPMPNEDLILSTSHVIQGAIFEAKGESVTNSNGVLNATFKAPIVSKITLVTLNIENYEGTVSRDVGINIYPYELPKLYLTTEVDLDIIRYDQKSNITLELTSYEEVDNISIYASIYPSVGNCSLDPPFPQIISSGKNITATFQAPEVEEGSIQRFTIEFSAIRYGVESEIEHVTILVEGPDEKGTVEEIPGIVRIVTQYWLTILMMSIVAVAIVVVIIRSKTKSGLWK